MTSLDRNLRKQLENKVKDARRVAEAGARQSIEQLAVHHHEPWTALTPDQRRLRNRLRAHGRQLGDRLDERKGTQSIDRLVGECAYEHWHRLLFARFLAENDLLVEPKSGIAFSLDECRELARERAVDWIALASDIAQWMLPQIFRPGDPVLEVMLPPEKRQELETLLESLPRDVFVADDSLGWVYQFWQAEEKDRVNKSGNKIGANELPAVTQLFTEDYMVLFLLHNTLGAWWAGKVLAARPNLARSATSESEVRRACALAGVEWTYLRFVQVDAAWRPAAGTFDGWPKVAKDITLLDPCMGSGHFLVFSLPILAAMRMAEEGISKEVAVDAVLHENVFGLEIDPRCTQIAAFNLALAAWRTAGYRVLPTLHLACSGLSVSAKESEWLALANGEARLQAGMSRLYNLFQQAPTIGSLIDPRTLAGDLLEAGFSDLAPLLEQAVKREFADEKAHEIAVAASGLARAAEILAGRFTLVLTNVPYLGRGKQDDVLKKYCQRVHPNARADLAACFVERTREFNAEGGALALVSPQNWWFLSGYRDLRAHFLSTCSIDLIVTLGEEAWQTFGDRGPVATLMIAERAFPADAHMMYGVNALARRTIEEKTAELHAGQLLSLSQSGQHSNPDHRITVDKHVDTPLLNRLANSFQGIATGDYGKFGRVFWEFGKKEDRWAFQQSTVGNDLEYGGREHVLLWEGGRGDLSRSEQARVQGLGALGKTGVAVTQMRDIPATIYTGELFDNNCAVIVGDGSGVAAALWAFCRSGAFRKAVRQIDKKVSVTNATFAKVPFDLAHWQSVAAEQYPNGLPKPHSDNPTQWLFNGHPKGAEAPLQVTIARLLGYRWPRQTGSSFVDCPALGPDGLDHHADDDGIVCLTPLRGEASAADRIRALVADAFGVEWSAVLLDALLKDVGHAERSLDDWLRDSFFEQHCELFHQRPFVWHIWDGLRNGFGALVNYHRLAASNGEGRRALEKLIYTYLGDWIDRQRADQKAGIEGADARVVAAEHLKRELEKVLVGEPPYDIFVRWKPLDQQPVGWEPDLDDGVRINIRPFMAAKPSNARGKNASILRVAPKIKWDKDRGKEPNRPRGEYPWFWGCDEQATNFLGGSEFDGNRWNDLHYSSAVKLAARDRVKGAKS